MNQNLFNRSDLLTLLQELDDGTLDSARRQYLYDLLMSSSEARKVYHEYMGFVAVLQDEVRTQAEKNLLPILPGSSRRRLRKNFSRAVLYAAAMIVITLIIARFVMAPEAVPYARVTPSADIVWKLTQGEVGENTPPGVITPGSTIHITHGSLNISLPDHTELILEGPAALEFPESLYQPELKKGRLWVDSNIGKKPFSVITSGYLVKDIGTRFGIFSADTLEIHVFEGIVQLIDRKSDEELIQLKENEAVSISAKGGSSVIPLISGPFPTKEQTATSIRFAQNFKDKNNILASWTPLTGSWKQGKDGLLCKADLHGLVAHTALPTKEPFFVSMDFKLAGVKSGNEWIGLAWDIPLTKDEDLNYVVFRVATGSGRVTISRVRNELDREPALLASSVDEGGDLGPLEPGQKYRMTVSSGHDGELTGNLYALDSSEEPLMTLSVSGSLSGAGNLGIYSWPGKVTAVEKFMATTTRSDK